jgi:hypothetical protein
LHSAGPGINLNRAFVLQPLLQDTDEFNCRPFDLSICSQIFTRWAVFGEKFQRFGDGFTGETEQGQLQL